MDLRVIAVEADLGIGNGVAGLLTGSDFIAALKGKSSWGLRCPASESMVGDDTCFWMT